MPRAIPLPRMIVMAPGARRVALVIECTCGEPIDYPNWKERNRRVECLHCGQGWEVHDGRALLRAIRDAAEA